MKKFTKKKIVTGSSSPHTKDATLVSPPAKKKSKTVKSVIDVISNPFVTQADFEEPGKFFMLYSPPGEGKTTVAAHAPNPLFIHTSDEQGIKQAITYKVVPAEVKDWLVELNPVCDIDEIPTGGHPGWQKLIHTLHTFEAGNHSRRTVVIDTCSGLQTLCHQHCASLLFNQDMVAQDGFMSFYKGYHKAAEQFWQMEFLTLCSRIVAKGYNVVLLAHSSLSNEPNPSGPDYQSYSPDLEKKIWNYTKKAIQGLFFMGRCQSLKKEGQKTKVSAETRFIGTTKTAWYEAKNWFNLNEPIDIGKDARTTWDNIQAKLKLK